MSDNGCGCPHPREEHGGCAAGEYCQHDDCRCVDGTYYGPKVKTADRVIKTVYVEPDVRSRDTLLDFVRYCEDHPQERFWQALRNWSGFNFILGVKDWVSKDDPRIRMDIRAHNRILVADYDTFNREGK